MTEATNNETTPAAKPVKPTKTTEVSQEIVLETNAFDPTKRELLDQSEAEFMDTMAQAYPGKKVENVRLVKVNHHVGKFAYYTYAGEIVA